MPAAAVVISGRRGNPAELAQVQGWARDLPSRCRCWAGAEAQIAELGRESEALVVEIQAAQAVKAPLEEKRSKLQRCVAGGAECCCVHGGRL